jgi:hypothetical protein
MARNAREVGPKVPPTPVAASTPSCAGEWGLTAIPWPSPDPNSPFWNDVSDRGVRCLGFAKDLPRCSLLDGPVRSAVARYSGAGVSRSILMVRLVRSAYLG